MKKFTILTTLLCTAFFSSCTDDATNPNANCSLENSLKLQTGNYWIYNTVELDTNGNAIAGTEATDSSIVAGTRIISGKTAYLITSFNSKKSVPDSVYYAIDGGRAFQLLGSVIKIFGDKTCDCVQREWVKFADCGSVQWKAVDFIPEGVKYEVVDEKGNVADSEVRWHYLANGFSKGNQDISFANETKNASVFSMKGTFSFEILKPENVTFISNPPGMRKLPMQVDNTFWLADGIGIVKYESKGFNRFAGSDPIVNGIRKTLIRYSVK